MWVVWKALSIKSRRMKLILRMTSHHTLGFFYCCCSADWIPALPQKCTFTSFFACIVTTRNEKTWTLSYNKCLGEVLSECHFNVILKKFPCSVLLLFLWNENKQLHSKQGKRVANGQWKLWNSELGSSLCAKDSMNMKEIFILLLNLYLVFRVQAIRGETQIYILVYPSIIAFSFVSVSFFQLMFFLIFCLLFCFLLLLFSKL